MVKSLRAGDVVEDEEGYEPVVILAPYREVWLDGPLPSPTRVGAHGYSLRPFALSGALTPRPYSVVLYVSGRTLMRRIIGGTEESEEVGPGDISLFPSFVPTQIGWQQPIQVLSISIDPWYLSEIAKEFVGTPCTLRMRYGLRLQDDRLVQLGQDLIEELTLPRPFASERGACAVSERIAIHLLRRHFDIDRSGAHERRFTDAESAMLCAWIDEHLDVEIHRERLARLLHLGVQQFTRICQRSFARAPHDLVRERRLQRARSLLLASEESVASIAMSTGFADQSHLTRCFKERFGEPPARHRRGHRERERLLRS